VPATLREHQDRVSDLVIELLEALPAGEHDRLQLLARAIDQLVCAAYAHGARAARAEIEGA
jgi:hypothetical protein